MSLTPVLAKLTCLRHMGEQLFIASKQDPLFGLAALAKCCLTEEGGVVKEPLRSECWHIHT